MLTEILFLTTGGTIDKVYFDKKSDYEVGRTIIGDLLEQALVRHPYRVQELLHKDSLEITDADRQLIRDAVAAADNAQIVITHGTDTMTDTAAWLADVPGKTIVMTGSLSPARFADSDAMFNVGMAIAAVQSLDQGVYIVMNGTVFPAADVEKNRAENRFQLKQPT